MKKLLKIILSLIILGLVACDSGFQKLDAGEYGVKFVKLPGFLGGGVSNKVITPGSGEFIMPWEDLYKIDTTIQSLSWGPKGLGSNPYLEDSVQTRTIDGNEVLISMEIQYYIDPLKLPYIIQYVAGEKGEIEAKIKNLVSAVARADIRTFLNTLSTREVFNITKRQEALDKLKVAMNARLIPEGIIIDTVIYNSHKFERTGPDGKVLDDSYQQKLDQTQATIQETIREEKLVSAIEEQKKIEYNDALGQFNRKMQEAEGHLEQAKLKGDSYLKAKELEADRIRSVGKQEIEGLKKRIEALNGPGGEALLRIEIAQELQNAQQKFVIINSDGTGSIGVNKLDSNNLLQQMGIAEATKEGVAPNSNLVPNAK